MRNKFFRSLGGRFVTPLTQWAMSVAWSFSMVACGGEPPPSVLSLGAEQRDSAGVRIISLDVDLNRVARAAGVGVLVSDLKLGSGDPGFTDIADVATTGDTVLVLDRNDGAVHVFAAGGGTPLGRFGTRGQPPGQLTLPVALEPVGSWIVVLQGTEGGTTLTLFPSDGSPPTASTPPVPGDWDQFMFRGPLLNLDYPTSSGIEDWSRRIASWDDSTLAILVREKEHVMNEGRQVRPPSPVHLLRLTLPLPGRVLDTLAILRGPSVELWRPAAGRRPPMFRELMYGARPLWAVGGEWYALGDGDSASVRIYRKDGTLMSIVRWPSKQARINDEDRLAAAAYAARYNARSSEEVRRRFSEMSPAQLAEAYRLHLPLMSFAETAPQITALYGAGECLWMSGFNPKDFLDGISLTWVGINVHTGELIPPVRIPGTDVRVRHFDRKAVYTKEFTDEDVQTVVRYPLPGTAC